jgi:DNA modification methylase
LAAGGLGRGTGLDSCPRSGRPGRHPNTAATTHFCDELHGLHPCPRPLDLCENLIKNFTVENGLILDCFAGSGQIPLAVKRVGGGRRCVAVEINPRYCEVAERRLRECRP